MEEWREGEKGRRNEGRKKKEREENEMEERGSKIEIRTLFITGIPTI